MSNYIVSNDTVRIIPDAAINISPKLPIGTYTVEMIAQTGELFLKKTEDFQKPKRIYGEAERQSYTVINDYTFLDFHISKEDGFWMLDVFDSKIVIRDEAHKISYTCDSLDEALRMCGELK